MAVWPANPSLSSAAQTLLVNVFRLWFGNHWPHDNIVWPQRDSHQGNCFRNLFWVVFVSKGQKLNDLLCPLIFYIKISKYIILTKYCFFFRLPSWVSYQDILYSSSFEWSPVCGDFCHLCWWITNMRVDLLSNKKKRHKNYKRTWQPVVQPVQRVLAPEPQ